jgi:hypothetical protein
MDEKESEIRPRLKVLIQPNKTWPDSRHEPTAIFRLNIATVFPVMVLWQTKGCNLQHVLKSCKNILRRCNVMEMFQLAHYNTN